MCWTLCEGCTVSEVDCTPLTRAMCWPLCGGQGLKKWTPLADKNKNAMRRAEAQKLEPKVVVLNVVGVPIHVHVRIDLDGHMSP
jgi:hypothetical protein